MVAVYFVVFQLSRHLHTPHADDGLLGEVHGHHQGSNRESVGSEQQERRFNFTYTEILEKDKQWL